MARRKTEVDRVDLEIRLKKLSGGGEGKVVEGVLGSSAEMVVKKKKKKKQKMVVVVEVVGERNKGRR